MSLFSSVKPFLNIHITYIDPKGFVHSVAPVKIRHFVYVKHMVYFPDLIGPFRYRSFYLLILLQDLSDGQILSFIICDGI